MEFVGDFRKLWEEYLSAFLISANGLLLNDLGGCFEKYADMQVVELHPADLWVICESLRFFVFELNGA